MDVHGFEEENIVVLMDDGIHEEPTMANIIEAYEQIVEDSEDGDAVFLHYSGEWCNYQICSVKNRMTLRAYWYKCMCSQPPCLDL
jgi:hypothetical protein